jgi:hypothetical protein
VIIGGELLKVGGSGVNIEYPGAADKLLLTVRVTNGHCTCNKISTIFNYFQVLKYL